MGCFYFNLSYLPGLVERYLPGLVERFPQIQHTGCLVVETLGQMKIHICFVMPCWRLLFCLAWFHSWYHHISDQAPKSEEEKGVNMHSSV